MNVVINTIFNKLTRLKVLNILSCICLPGLKFKREINIIHEVLSILQQVIVFGCITPDHLEFNVFFGVGYQTFNNGYNGVYAGSIEVFKLQFNQYFGREVFFELVQPIENWFIKTVHVGDEGDPFNFEMPIHIECDGRRFLTGGDA